MKTWLQWLEDVFPGYTYYFLAVSAAAFMTPILSAPTLGSHSYILQIGVVVGSVAGFVFVYRSTHARIMREWYNDQ